MLVTKGYDEIMEHMIDTFRHLLLVGEGNFSFSLTTLQRLKNTTKMVATCYEDQEMVFSRYKGAQRNVNILTKIGATVLYGIDATNLHQCPSLVTEGEFDCIIFQFPHVGGKASIKKNRQLLKEFFMSASQLISEDGAVIVTLCNGQGGTPSDSPQREWHNSWQVVSMATYGGLILTQTDSFDSGERYRCTGYRSQDKSFNTSGAVVHFFQKGCEVSSSIKDQTERLQRVKILREETFELLRKRLCDSWRKDSCNINYLPLGDHVITKPIDRESGSNSGNSSHGGIRSKSTNCQRYSDPCSELPNDYLVANSNIPIHPCLCQSLDIVNNCSPSWTLVLVQGECDISSLCYPIKRYLVVKVSRDNSAEEERNNFINAILETTGIKFPQESHFKVTGANHDRNCCFSKKTDIEQGTLKHDDFAIPISFAVSATESSFVAAVCLDHVVMNKYGLKDFRLLWSLDVRWWTLLSHQNDRSVTSVTPIKLCPASVTPISLYPVSYVHDLSFWSNGAFDEHAFFSLVRGIAGNDIREVSLLETYHVDDVCRESRCYRMVYQSCDKALTKEYVNSTQGKIRAAIETELRLIPR